MHISMKKILARPIWYPWPLLSLFFTSNNAYKHENCSRRSRTVFGRCRWCRYGSRMEVPALLNQDLGHQSGFNIQGAFKTSYHIVLDDLWSMQSHRISAKVLIPNVPTMGDVHTKNQGTKWASNGQQCQFWAKLGHFLAKNPFFLTRGIKSFVTHITENPPGHLVHIAFGRALDKMCQKGQYLAQNDKKCIFWPILDVSSGVLEFVSFQMC